MKTIRQTVLFKASPHEVFEALMDSKKHSNFTGDKAVISRKAGGRFKAYGDYITGKNLEIVKDKLIVQSWKASDWDKGVESKVTFKMEKERNKTRLKFTHENVPDNQYASIKQGWVEYYWDGMKEMLEKG